MEKEEKNWEKPFEELTNQVNILAENLNKVLELEKQLPIEKRSNWGNPKSQSQPVPQQPKPQPTEEEIFAAKLNAETAQQVRDEGREYRTMVEPWKQPQAPESDLKTIAEQVNTETEKIKQDRRDAALEKILKIE